MKSTTYVRRLGPHHFAHLRAVAEGIAVQESAGRYLAIDHGHQAVTAHREVVDRVRSISRRRGDKAWRLIGLVIKSVAEGDRPSLEEFIAERGLDGWSESEVAEMYAEAYPLDPKAQRRARLRVRQLELIRALEGAVAERPQPTDMVDGWFEESIARRMITAGCINLADLAKVVARGGRWYRAMPGIGVGKARRIEAHLWTLLDRASVPQERAIALRGTSTSIKKIASAKTGPVVLRESDLARSSGSEGTDADLITRWIMARSKANLTATKYRREGQRLLLWLAHERGGRRIAELDDQDCLAYMAFLQYVPERWISRRNAEEGQPGWAPFRTQPSQKSIDQSLTIIRQLFNWLEKTKRIPTNPWNDVNSKIGDDKDVDLLDTRALSKGAYKEILRVVDEFLPGPERYRMQFLLRFLPATGIRASELLAAKLGDVRLSDDGGWVLQVHGKGAKNRLVIIPGQAYDALQEYLGRRGLGDLQSAPLEAPLLASTKDPMGPVGYQSLYQTMRSWITRAIRESDLPASDRSKASKASAHWMRHCFGTWAVAAGVPLDVIQAQMGHESITTTMNIYGKAPLKRRAEELAKAFG